MKRRIFLFFKYVGLAIVALGLILSFVDLFSPNPFLAEVGRDLIAIGLTIFFCHFFLSEKKKKRGKGVKQLILRIMEYVSLTIVCVGFGFCCADFFVSNSFYLEIATTLNMIGCLIYFIQFGIGREKKDENDTNEGHNEINEINEIK